MNFKKWREDIYRNRKRIYVALFLVAVAITFQLMAGEYLQDHTNFVTAHDLILDNFGPYHLAPIFVWGFITVMVLYFGYSFIFDVDHLPYAMNMFSLFIMVRAFSVILTHLGAPAGALTTPFPGFLQAFNLDNGYFFSAHTGIPFLGFLVYRKKHKIFGYVMLAFSILLAITVLLMHVHYSIDVFSAYFITFGIYTIGNKFSRK